MDDVTPFGSLQDPKRTDDVAPFDTLEDPEISDSPGVDSDSEVKVKEEAGG